MAALQNCCRELRPAQHAAWRKQVPLTLVIGRYWGEAGLHADGPWLTVRPCAASAILGVAMALKQH